MEEIKVPLKIEMELENFDLEGEPLYDMDALEIYCKKYEKQMQDLSEEEKKQFIVGYMSI